MKKPDICYVSIAVHIINSIAVYKWFRMSLRISADPPGMTPSLIPSHRSPRLTHLKTNVIKHSYYNTTFTQSTLETPNNLMQHR